MKKLQILGIRGVPANHGGFETFAHHLSKYLVSKNWAVTVFCQEKGGGQIYETVWEGVDRVHIPVAGGGSISTMVFDWQSIRACNDKDTLVLTLGYNTAFFCAMLRIRGIRNVINMDGIEWRRGKWGWVAKTWFWLNERMGCYLGNKLVADHPDIKKHLMTRVSASKIKTIAYGANLIESKSGDQEVLAQFDLAAGSYALVVARPEPENSILEVISAFSKKNRNCTLVVLGHYDFEDCAYHRAIKQNASEEVRFIGAVYNQEVLSTLRYHARLYIHGHTVGGTNPSLVEALGASSALMCHNNKYNRWVAEDAAVYFDDIESASNLLDCVLDDKDKLDLLKTRAKSIYTQRFTWKKILSEYEELLTEEFGKISA